MKIAFFLFFSIILQGCVVFNSAIIVNEHSNPVSVSVVTKNEIDSELDANVSTKLMKPNEICYLKYEGGYSVLIRVNDESQSKYQIGLPAHIRSNLSYTILKNDAYYISVNNAFKPDYEYAKKQYSISKPCFDFKF